MARRHNPHNPFCQQNGASLLSHSLPCTCEEGEETKQEITHSRKVAAITSTLLVVGLVAVVGLIGAAVVSPSIFGVLLLVVLIAFGLLVGRG